MINGMIPSRFGVSRTYVKFIVGFIVLAIILIFIIFYFSFGRALIQVTPRVASVATDFIEDVYVDSSDSQTIKSVLFTTEVEQTKNYTATGTKDVEGDIIGQVTIVNNLAQNQPLVATTRLLSADNVLLRIKNRVDVPANGSVIADVFADDPSSFENLAPTKFTIPGLSQSLQSEIYAESKSNIKSKPGSIKVVKAVDIARAKEDLSETLYSQAIEEFKQEIVGDYAAVVVAKKLVKEEVSVEVDQTVDEFAVTQVISVTVLGLDQMSIVNLAADRLKQLVPEGKELSNIQLDNLSYVTQNYDPETKTANIKIHVEGEIILRDDSSILDKNKIVGLSARGVQLYLESFDEIETVKVELSPFWVKKVPGMLDHITIELIK